MQKRFLRPLFELRSLLIIYAVLLGVYCLQPMASHPSLHRLGFGLTSFIIAIAVMLQILGNRPAWFEPKDLEQIVRNARLWRKASVGLIAVMLVLMADLTASELIYKKREVKIDWERVECTRMAKYVTIRSDSENGNFCLRPLATLSSIESINKDIWPEEAPAIGDAVTAYMIVRDSILLGEAAYYAVGSFRLEKY